MAKRDRKAILSGDDPIDPRSSNSVVELELPSRVGRSGTEGAWLRQIGRSTKSPSNPNNPIGALREALERKFENEDARVEALTAQLNAGETIVEIDPADIDESSFSDRMDLADEEIDLLAAQIKDQGQLVAILVRPHPENRSRFQVAYGHRRLKAAAKLGVKVRAVVRELNDNQLAVAQGQENSARSDLSFIEKARFATELEERGFSRNVICDALTVTENNLSTMIGIAQGIPRNIVESIGKAPGIGRPRWNELLSVLKEPRSMDRAMEVVRTEKYRKLPSHERFVSLLDQMTKRHAPAARSGSRALQQSSWMDPHGRKRARINTTDSKCTIQIDRRDDPEFAAFVVSKLDDIYREYEEKKK